jgi:hypothetical protein
MLRKLYLLLKQWNESYGFSVDRTIVVWYKCMYTSDDLIVLVSSGGCLDTKPDIAFVCECFFVHNVEQSFEIVRTHITMDHM